MSAEQFFQVVLLPQGQFARFLHASAQDKEALLQKLFSTDRFRAVERWLADRRLSIEKEVAAKAGDLSVLVAQVAQAADVAVPDAAPDSDQDPASGRPSWRRTPSPAQEQAAVHVAARSADLERALAAKSEAEQLAGRQRRRRDALRRQRELQDAAPVIAALRAEADAALRAAQVKADLDAADRAATAAARALTAEARARALIADRSETGVADLPGDATAETLHAAAEEQRTHLGRLDALARRRPAGGRRGRERDRRPRPGRRDRRGAGRGRGCGGGPRAGAAAGRRKGARRPARPPPSCPRRGPRRTPAGGWRPNAAALVKERASRDRLHEAHLAAREKAVETRTTALAVREARIDGMRAELAATMTDGSPCPVCGSLDHPDPVEPTFEPVSRDAEDAANALADQATAKADKAGQDVAAADGRIGELAQRLRQAGFAALETATGRGHAARPTPPTRRGRRRRSGRRVRGRPPRPIRPACPPPPGRRTPTPSGSRPRPPGWRRRRPRCPPASASLTRSTTPSPRQRQAGRADRAAQGGRGRGRGSRRARGAAPRRTERAAGRRRRPDAAINAARRRSETLAAAAEAAAETVRTAAEAAAAADRALRAATEAGFAAPAGSSSQRISQRIRRRRRPGGLQGPGWRGDAAGRVGRHETETATVAAQLADPDLAVDLEPAAPVAETASAAAAAREAHDAANGVYATAKRTADQLALLAPKLADPLTALAPLRERADQIRQIAELANGNGANQYRMTLSSFVLAARLEEVAQAASERLLTMTAGRYSLAHSDARKGNAKAGLSLLACDSWTGVDRDTATLSGGETFLASLALALGLADVVTAEAAGTPMEALFVDEGFGTLDEETLDEVMNVLDGLRAGGRIVGIVSHVTELRQRIPAQVHVAKGRHGSHVTVTVG